jgi:hypothetical protein
MKPPYPEKLSEALKDVGHDKPVVDYAQILKEPELTADFIRQRLKSKRQWFDQWLDRNKDRYKRLAAGPWQDMVLQVVYKENLGIQVPDDGKVAYKNGDLLIVNWQSWCPVLTHCAHTGQPTLPVCCVLYHMQLQCLLSLVLPGALFTRDYSRIRPGDPCCREIIFYDCCGRAQGMGDQDAG